MESISGYVLAGGKSSRFGSNKALALLAGKPMIEYSLDLLRQYSQYIYISGVKDEYKFLNIAMIEDLVNEKGPISGIYSCLKKATTQYNLILSCDMPFVSKQMIEYLLAHSKTNEATYFTNDQKDIYPFPGVYTKQCLPIIEQMLNMNNYRMKNLLDRVCSKACEIDRADQYRLTNINREEDLNDSLEFI